MLKLDPFYPIVPDTDWLARLLPQGVRFVQLRIKDTDASRVEAEIARGVELAHASGALLVVNDYWREAIAAGASFVHLGQEDLAGADLSAIKAARLKLGVSTHSLEELEIALAAEPDYVALGPIFPTKLKQMPWAPQGLARIAEWREHLQARGRDLPLVAIGGMDVGRAASVLAAGASSVSVITDIVTNEDPQRRTREWIEATAAWRNLSTHYSQR